MRAESGVGKIRKSPDVADVFETTGAPKLSLVTCGGASNSKTGHYLDNVIVGNPVAAATAGN
jgi:hypothetical protein